MNCLEDRLDSPFSSPLAMFEDEHNGSEGWWSTTNPRLGVQVDSQRLFTPLPSTSPAVTTPILVPSNMDHRQMTKIIDELMPLPALSYTSPTSSVSLSSSGSSGSPGSELSSSEEFGAVPAFSSMRFDPALGDGAYDPFHSFSAGRYCTFEREGTLEVNVPGYDDPSFTQPTVDPKLVVVSPPIENSDGPTEDEDEDEDEDETPAPAPSPVKQKDTRRSARLNPIKPKGTTNKTKRRANTMTKVKASAKKAQRKNLRGVWRPPPGLPACCAKCKSSSALSRHKTNKDHFAHFPHERLTALKYWCPITACKKSRQNAPDIEEAFYRDGSLCRHLENVHGFEHDLEYVQSLGTID